MQTMRDPTDERFDDLNPRVSNRLARMEQRLDRMDRRMERADRNVTDRFDRMDRSVSDRINGAVNQRFLGMYETVAYTVIGICWIISICAMIIFRLIAQ